MRSRAQEMLPQVLLTVLSIMQALALEVLWTSAGESPHLHAGGFAAVVGWMQVGAVFLGILVMWLFYVSIVLRFRWTPKVRDAIVPFFLGLMEFGMAEMLAPEYLHLWCYLLAAVFAGAAFTSAVMIRDAMGDEAQQGELEAGLSPRAGRAFSVAVVAILTLAGAAVHWAGPGGWVALMAVVIANGVLLAQAVVIRHFWNLHLHPA